GGIGAPGSRPVGTGFESSDDAFLSVSSADAPAARASVAWAANPLGGAVDKPVRKPSTPSTADAPPFPGSPGMASLCAPLEPALDPPVRVPLPADVGGPTAALDGAGPAVGLAGGAKPPPGSGAEPGDATAAPPDAFGSAGSRWIDESATLGDAAR